MTLTTNTMTPEVADKIRRAEERRIRKEAMEARIGTRAFLAVDDRLQMEVEILGVQERYGNLDWLVTPVAGTGERPVAEHRLILK